MATNNAINAPLPLSATQGGSGSASPTAHGVLIAEGASAFVPVVLAAGQVLVGTTSSDPAAATITGSGGITVSSTTGAINIAGSGGGITWVNVTTTSQAMSINTGYIANNASLVTLTLPSTAAIGSIISVAGNGAGGWLIAQNAGQSINFGNASPTTTGVTGSLASTNRYDQVDLICTVANSGWVVRSSLGNITIV